MSLFNLTSSLFDDLAFGSFDRYEQYEQYDPFEDFFHGLHHARRARAASAASAASVLNDSSTQTKTANSARSASKQSSNSSKSNTVKRTSDAQISSKPLCDSSNSLCASISTPSKRLRTSNWLANIFDNVTSNMHRDSSALSCVGACDVVETPNAFVISADVPGLTAKDVKVQLTDDNVLHISGKRSQTREEKGTTSHFVERSHGSFIRSFGLPEGVNRDDIQANVEQGVLRVRVGKQTEPPQPRVFDIPVLATQASSESSSNKPTTSSFSSILKETPNASAASTKHEEDEEEEVVEEGEEGEKEEEEEFENIEASDAEESDD